MVFKNKRLHLIAYSFLSVFLGNRAFSQAPALLPTPPSSALAPYYASFSNGQKSLIYVGVVHHSSNAFPNAMLDPTFETVTEVMNNFPPQAVIVEGVSSTQVPSGIPGFEEYSARCAANNFNILNADCAEPEYTAYLAQKMGADVYGGEPSGPDELATFIANRYTTTDVMAYYLMREIPVLRRNMTNLSHDNFPSIAASLISEYQTRSGTAIPFALSDFENWYSSHMPVPADYLDLTVQETGPLTGTGSTVLQQQAAVDSLARDGSIVKMINEVTAKYDHVVVVYGASHLDFEWNSIYPLFGQPVISHPFPYPNLGPQL